MVSWLEFLWLAAPAHFRVLRPFEEQTATFAEWAGGDPFMASVLAIDEFLLGVNPETGRTLDLRTAEVCPWLAGDDRVAVRAAVEAVHTPPPPSPTPPPPAPVTVADIAELMRFKRLDAEMAAKRAALPLPRTIADASWYTNQSAMFAVYPGRLTEETAAEIPAYRRLVQQAQKDYARPLDEETLR